MTNKIVFGTLILLISLVSFSFINSPNLNEKPVATTNWITWDEALEKNKTAPKKIIIDLYTDWCGWCKKMDKSTFSNPKVAAYLNKNFYAVKLNAEQKESIFFQNKEFKYINAGKRGVHELAYALVDGKMSYPTVVYLTENMERVMVSPGYKGVKQIMKELSYVGDEAYKTTQWENYSGK